MFTEREKSRLFDFIKQCRQSEKEPQKEAVRRFIAVRDSLQVNTPVYRLAFSKPTGFFVLNTKEEAIRILQKEAIA